MAITERSTPERSVPPAFLANVTVTSAFVANFFTDFLIVEASKDAVRSIFLSPDPTRVVICDFSRDLRAVKLSASRLLCRLSTRVLILEVSRVSKESPTIADVTSTLVVKFSIFATPSVANVDM